MNDKEKMAIEETKNVLRKYTLGITPKLDIEVVDTLLNIIEKQKEEIEKKDNIINNSIIEIEKLRQYFSEDLQVEFIRILEILKDKKVIDW